MLEKAFRLLLLAGLALPGAGPVEAAESGEAGSADIMAAFPAGSIALPFRENARGTEPSGNELSIDSLKAARLAVAAFRLDRRAVTHGEFLAFVRSHPRFARSRIPPALADGGYLRSWRGDPEPPQGREHEPVTGVSWYAAKAYCAAQGKRLPSTAEWERAAATYPIAPDAEVSPADSTRRERAILAWYGDSDASKENPNGTRHAEGVTGLFGVIWEWTADFNAWSGSGVNARGVRAAEGETGPGGLVCGGAPAGMLPNTPYSTYMRWAFRASLSPEYTVATLGFRCADDDTPNEGKTQ